MIKAIIFDLNGIFMISEKLSIRFEKDFNIPVQQFLPALNKIMDKVRKPNSKPAFSYWKLYLDKWSVNLSEEEFWNYWFKAEKPSDKMLGLAKEIKSKGLKIFLLSNNFKERSDYYAHYRWFSNLIDKGYFSWESGYVKPDPNAWKNLLKDNKLKPEECIFFDDQMKNVESAKVIGIHSFVFENVSKSKKIIENLTT